MDALFEATLSNVLFSLPLALAAWGLARRRRSPALVHGLWLVVLLKLVTPPLVRVPIALPVPPELARSESPAARADEAPILSEHELATLGTFLAAPLSVPDPAPIPALAAPARELPWRELLLAVWILGACATWMLAAQRIRLLRELLRFSTRAPARIEREARVLARRLGLARLPELRVVPGRLAPMLLSAGRRAQLVLPEELLPRLDADARRTLLAHELAHFKRRDHLVRWLELFVRGLHWWNPLARWSVRGLRAAEESCCDAWVVWALPGSARTYAGALVDTADFLCGAAPIPETAAGAFSRADELQRRLTMILHTDTSKSLTRRGRLGLLAVALAALPFLPAFSQTPGEGQDEASQLAEIEARIADVQAQRAELATKLAEIEREATQDGLRPAHSRYKHLARQLAALQATSVDMDGAAAALLAQAAFIRATGGLGRTVDSTAIDERREALKKGAQALMNGGDMQAAHVLLSMLDELPSPPAIDPRVDSLEQLLKLGYVSKDGKDKQKSKDAKDELKRHLERLLAASSDDVRPSAWPTPTDDRLATLEQRLNALTELVERLAQSLELDRAAPGGSGGGR